MSHSESRLNRRRFLQGSATLAGATVTGMSLTACGDETRITPQGGGSPSGAGFRFLHGVASGDPLSDRVILWSRVTPSPGRQGPVAVDWRLARDPELSDVVASGRVQTDSDRDFTVKVDATGLAPGSTYYYRFSAGNAQSPIGRTRTAPVGAVERLRVGVASCSSLAHGVFNAYRRLAARDDLDVILHLGDYIYEYGNGEYGSARDYEPPHEILTLADYRQRYAQYRRDPDLQEAHRQHPFIAVWDDHESADNSWRDGAANHTEGDEGLWTERLAASIQSYYEWMPIRVTEAGNPLRIYRQFRYGDLAEFDMLDTRIIGRDQEAQFEGDVSVPGFPLNPATIDAATLNDESRTLVGEEQLQWLSDALNASTAKWKFLGQQVMFGQLQIIGTPDLAELLSPAQGQLRLVPVAGSGGLLLNPDQWDGYAAERRRVWNLIRGGQNNPDVAIDNVVVLTGDIHTSWAMDITEDPNNPVSYNPLTGAGSMAVEFVCTSVTSPGLGLPPEVETTLEQAAPTMNPHMKYVNLRERGYMLLDITPERAQAEWYYVPTIDEPSDEESLGAVWATADGENRVQEGEASAPRDDAPPPAPEFRRA